ncbi:P-loop containing nucleoside triphosphate hydrolase protein [Pleomassaria siparia CBS 279.74]|uniref:P-loop containing nucleoside triphosphate hydrolase protein n=1 Tax=Pleomassaria siparia CBS 279.74 TaxID=1314801 RepID=A0A6G1JU29_9PLEO|nr:P-loop containing nucleoside triphosphate hydrolase protein [Pleomassaria siparia CBS 279.74]
MAPEEQRARSEYSYWKRLIKYPPQPNDERTVERLWNGALAILNGDEREWKQMVPRDLDDDEYYGRQHMKRLLDTRTRVGDSGTFIRLIRPFLLVVSHSSFLDCLSVDTCVGGLYNFISGTNGTRAVPFFQHVCESLIDAHIDTTSLVTAEIVETTLVAMSTALCELLKRESRARFNDDLPTLTESLRNTVHMTMEEHSQTSAIVLRKISEVQAIVNRAKGLLNQEEEEHEASPGITVTSTYPRRLVIPGGRHDNDNADITKIKIFPTLEEILSEEAEFLPPTDLDQPHFLADPTERHIDTHFRLLRYDCFGELKEALGGLVYSVLNNPACLNSPKLTFGDFRAHHYPSACISYLSFDLRRGLEADITFPQLTILRKKSASERQKWWKESKRLAEGILLSFVAFHDNEIQHLFFTVSEKNTNTNLDRSLTSEIHESTITVKLASHDQLGVESMVRLSCQRARGVLIEFPGVLPATFVPILENLQEMQRLGRLPFRQWILPDKTGNTPEVAKIDIPPPLYARKSGFTFSLKPIIRADKSHEGTVSINPTSSADDRHAIEEMEAWTDLDRGQCRALLAALTREFAFIQGPPGTGKSYVGVQLMKVLMHCKRTVKLGPVIVVCYTNHALDQFLEHLHAVGIKKIIRIGGQSKSAVLEDHNLRKVSQSETKTGSESRVLTSAYDALEQQTQRIQSSLRRVHGLPSGENLQNLENHLEEKYPLIYYQFSQFDDDGFEFVGRHPFHQWWSTSGSSFSESEIGIRTTLTVDQLKPLLQKAESNVHSLSQQERRSLIQFWVQEAHNETLDDLFERVKATDTSRQQLANVHDEVDRRVLQDADIIGITTTGLAKRIAALRRVKSKIVICEEAGEVMESHMISALLPAVEHFIQIGDHEQLRPQINNYNLSLESRQGALYQLDRSQFERLSVGEPGRSKMPVAQLNVQRRMRPEISTLIRETIYRKLVDHPSTTLLPNVVGMRMNVFWLDHDRFEEGQHSEMHHKSHSNLWEVEMVHGLVRHIVRQGEYSSTDIAVLTPYTGQLQNLRSAMRNDFEIVLSDKDQGALEKDGFSAVGTNSGDEEPDIMPSHRKAPLEKKQLSDLLRVATVDNFQGEEAKVIIVSLVRSNEERKVGFLKTTNRINVLLSRAQHGMYLIGNADTYSNVSMWQKVIGMLRASESVGESLALCCPRHKDTSIQVTQPDDFPRLSPEGGCREACVWRLPDCGHMCQARCHSESMHKVFSCPQPCQRLHEPCKHFCQKQTCGEDCGDCLIKLDHVQLPCGHIKSNVFCYLTQHLDAIRCDTQISKTVAGCNHVVEVSCSLDVTSDLYRCPTPCTSLLPCGHPCPGTCGQCNPPGNVGGTSSAHQQCRKICGRKFGTCNHTCRKRCHDGKDCGLCNSPCQVRCQHSQCTLLCHEACAPCIETCTWSCEHQGRCTMPCSAPCNRLPCQQRCSKKLPCGHQCPGLCGETCPETYCHKCTTKQDSRVDLLEMKTYAEIDINETPIVVLGCGHFFTAETLDGLIGMNDVYVSDKFGQFVGLADISGALASKIPQCPDCQRPVRQYVTQRYNRVINRAVMDEMSKRFLVNGKTELRDLEQEVDRLEEGFEQSHSGIIHSLRIAAHGTVAALAGSTRSKTFVSAQIQNRYDAFSMLSRKVKSFLQTVADRHQPAQKLHQAIIHATIANRSKSLDEGLASLGIQDTFPSVERDRRITLGGRLLQIRAECIVLEDKFRIAVVLKSTPSAERMRLPRGSPERLTKPFLQTCTAFIAESSTDNLPRFTVEASLYFAKIVLLYQSSGLSSDQGDRGKVMEYVREARNLLENALEICKQPFQNAEQLRKAVEESFELLGREWYETVTLEELAAIKQAMVTGPTGMATHSGHWYNCINGHPFAIGECGMPMEQARCPECGERIGGSNHEAVEGVTRAMDLE